MSLTDSTKEATKQEWRDLGFFYDYCKDQRAWKLVGDKVGILKFADILTEFANNEENQEYSSHEHFGPYGYLKVMTTVKPEITEHFIGGTLSDLQRLADIIRREVINCPEKEHSFYVHSSYAFIDDIKFGI